MRNFDKARAQAERLFNRADGSQRNEFRHRYREYLSSDHWRMLKQRKWHEVDPHCDCCGRRKRLELHHLQYRNWSDITTDDLIYLCRWCHSTTTKLQKEGIIPMYGDSQAIRLTTNREVFHRNRRGQHWKSVLKAVAVVVLIFVGWPTILATSANWLPI